MQDLLWMKNCFVQSKRSFSVWSDNLILVQKISTRFTVSSFIFYTSATFMGSLWVGDDRKQMLEKAACLFVLTASPEKLPPRKSERIHSDNRNHGMLQGAPATQGDRQPASLRCILGINRYNVLGWFPCVQVTSDLRYIRLVTCIQVSLY